MNSEYLAKIKSAEIAVIHDFGDYLGLDLTSKFPLDFEIVFLAPYKYTELVKEEYPNIPSDSLGFPNMENKIYINDLPDRTDAQKLKTLTHELIHSISYKESYINEKQKLRFHRLGFGDQDNYKFGLLDEGVTELSTFFVIKNYWCRHEDLKYYVPKSHSELLVSYSNMVVLIDMSITKLMGIYNKSYVEILKTIQQSLIQNPEIGLDMFKTALGYDGMRLVADQRSASTLFDDDAQFFVLMDKMPLKEEFASIQDGKGVYKFWDKL